MKRASRVLLPVLLPAFLAIGTLACGAASAHGHGGPRFGFDFVIGPWWWGPPGPGYYYPYYDPPVVYTAPAPVYVQPNTAQMPPPAYNWYFCAQSNAYYPYVSECPGGWQQVSPTPPAPTSPRTP